MHYRPLTLTPSMRSFLSCDLCICKYWSCYVLRVTWGDKKINILFDLSPIRNLAQFPVQYVTYAPYYSPTVLCWLCWLSVFTIVFINNKVIFNSLFLEQDTYLLYAHINQKEILVVLWMNRRYTVREVASLNPVTVICFFNYLFLSLFIFIYLLINLFEYNA